MIQPTSITRSKRKTISISISKTGEVSVRAPMFVSDKKIEDFILSKQKWIEDKLNKINANTQTFQDVINYKKLLVFGDKFTPVYSSNTKIELDDYGKILIPAKFKTPDKVFKKTKDWYKQLANDIIINRAINFTKSLRLTPSKIKINDSRGRWGACNSRGEIILNFRIAMLPPFLIDYVIIHELSHLIEMNHSPKFWNIMSIFMPNYKKAKEQIKNYSFCLTLFN